jgi:hypothetical protein
MRLLSSIGRVLPRRGAEGDGGALLAPKGPRNFRIEIIAFEKALSVNTMLKQLSPIPKNPPVLASAEGDEEDAYGVWQEYSLSCPGREPKGTTRRGSSRHLAKLG